VTDETTAPDIVVRLRYFFWGPQYSNDLCGKQCMADAAAEIERLRAAIRCNALRWAPHLTHEQIDEVIDGKQS